MPSLPESCVSHQLLSKHYPSDFETDYKRLSNGNFGVSILDLRRFDLLSDHHDIHLIQPNDKIQKSHSILCILKYHEHHMRDIYNDLVLREVIEEDPHDAPDGVIFRKEAVSVTNAAQKEIHQGIVPESAIQSAVQTVLDFIKDDSIDLLIRTGAAHYLFGYIHPFYNGNGRLSRFISSFLLTQELDPLIAYRLSYTVKENLTQYDDAFKLCNDPRNYGDITPFVLWFLEVVQEAIVKLDSALSERAHDLERYRSLLKQSAILNTKTLYELSYYLIQASLFSDEGTSTSTLIACTELSRTTLMIRLKEIEQYGLLLVQRSGKEKVYKLNLAKFEQLANG